MENENNEVPQTKEKKSFIATVVKEAIKAEVTTEYTGKTRDEIKAAIAANSAKAAANETLNNESIRLYRDRANESRVLREKNRHLRSLLSAEKKEATVEEFLGTLTADQIAELLAKAQSK